ncbi:DUF2247 family protein [Nocardia miyunensis]|uniref:DUF2247 family protein n=1 Tax=Nocardia miyunensis TaxID=282684 RepID=UPI0012F4BCF6|nr:DUF2247 family protein [Nocardia miyunensis]
MVEKRQFTMPDSFIEQNARLTPRELHRGYVDGWIDAATVVELCVRNVAPDSDPAGVVESLLLLLSDELDKVPDLVDRLVADDQGVWIFLTLAYVGAHPSKFDSILRAVEMLYADFDYPPKMESFVPFMPPPAGATPGVAGIEQRWDEYLQQERELYLDQRSFPTIQR